MLFWVQVSLAFIAGMIWNKLWNSLVSAGFSVLMVKKAQLECLSMMKHVNNSVELAIDIKHKHMLNSGLSANMLESENNLDQHILNGMRNHMIETLKMSIPRSYLSIAEYDDWSTAMKFLKENK
jgi:hypothetical protein